MYPEYNLVQVEVKIVRFLIDQDLEEDVMVDVYDPYDMDEIRKAVRDQHGYKEIDFEIVL